MMSAFFTFNLLQFSTIVESCIHFRLTLLEVWRGESNRAPPPPEKINFKNPILIRVKKTTFFGWIKNNKESLCFSSRIWVWGGSLLLFFPLQLKKNVSSFINGPIPATNNLFSSYCCLKTIRTILVRNKILFPNSFVMKIS